MQLLINQVYNIIRPRCISDYCANTAAIDIIKFFNDSRNTCACPPDIKTGTITETVCNICGRPEPVMCKKCGSHVDGGNQCLSCGKAKE